ncbi:MAG TPA: diadenylate cyclase CdaA [Planctomycetota bacterium]|nr:diadenylate cyclase CdaA [Planctomycetota bacterium]
MFNPFWPDLSGTSIVEILLISGFIFLCLQLFSRTRAAKMLWVYLMIIGLSFIATFVVSLAFQLNILAYIFELLFTAMVLGLLVIFAPEIRQLLALIQGYVDTGSAHLTPIDAVVEACAMMGARKQGALIVMQRENDLNDIAEGGVRIDARISPELIETIFFKDTQLHDGAVIIANNRIKAARCFLPGSQSPLDVNVGTRHRAALGLAEETDAVCLVVSEESGHLSIAAGGELFYALSAAEFKTKLTQLMRESEVKSELAGEPGLPAN